MPGIGSSGTAEPQACWVAGGAKLAALRASASALCAAKEQAMGEDWSDKVVVVTGASAGVGRAVVRAFARRGANVGLIARGMDGLLAARAEVEAMGGRALVLPLDVADAEAVDEAAGRVERELGPIDVWVNDAM